MCVYVCGWCIEMESTVVTQSPVPQLAAQSAPSIMRKRGYEHINGVEGERCNYSTLVLQSAEALPTLGCVQHVAAQSSSFVDMKGGAETLAELESTRYFTR